MTGQGSETAPSEVSVMLMIFKNAWRNLFRQKRRTAITVSAMAVSLIMAIPTYGLVEGLSKEMLRGITRMELGHVQIHDPAYAKGRALQSTLHRPERLLRKVRATRGVVSAAPRVHGSALASHDVSIDVLVVGVMSEELGERKVRFGHAIDPEAPWRKDPALACEAVVSREAAKGAAVAVGTVLTPKAARAGGLCERVRIVGLLTEQLEEEKRSDRLVLAMPGPDVAKAFGETPVSTEGVLRHAAPLQVEGVAPESEKEITFMADQVVEGRYLAAAAKDEIVVGYRLAEVLSLDVGDDLFVQAASLDLTRGTFYRSFEVVGIYRTGVDYIDRSKVFIHIDDAQELMALDDRIHEIVVLGRDARQLSGLVGRLDEAMGTMGLTVTTSPDVARGGSEPLASPATITETTDGEVGLLVPYDLKRRFEGLQGLGAVARRVYAKARVTPATTVQARLRVASGGALEALVGKDATTEPCHVYLPGAVKGRWKVEKGDVLRTMDAVTGGEPSCAELRVAGFYPKKRLLATRMDLDEGAEAAGPANRELPEVVVTSVNGRRSGGEDVDAFNTLSTGVRTLVIGDGGGAVRLVGVEPEHEKTASDLHEKVARGRYLGAEPEGEEGEGDEGVDVGPTGFWPVLLSQRAAKRIGVDVGQKVLIETRNGEDGEGWRGGVVVGVLADGKWKPGLPEMILPYFSAQQVDAERLNARAHELVLIPGEGIEPSTLVAAARESLSPLVRPWQQIAPDMARLIETQDTWVGIMLFIIFAIAALTVMNTMLMAVFERTREFGVLKSIGMKPRQVFGLIVIETAGLALIATVVGGALGVALDHYLVVHGLDLSAFTGGFTYQGTFISPVWRAVYTVKSIFLPIAMVALVCLLVSFYPAMRAGRLSPVDALHHTG